MNETEIKSEWDNRVRERMLEMAKRIWAANPLRRNIFSINAVITNKPFIWGRG